MDVFAWVILPLLIFFARVCDVSLGTIRVIFISKGIRYFAPLIGFFEVIIWLVAIGQVMNNLTNVACYIAYGCGFAMGTFVGMLIEERLSIGYVIIRVITSKPADELASRLMREKIGVTEVEAMGSQGSVKILLMVIKRHNMRDVLNIVRSYQPDAFFTIEDVRSVNEGIFPREVGWYSRKKAN